MIAKANQDLIGVRLWICQKKIMETIRLIRLMLALLRAGTSVLMRLQEVKYMERLTKWEDGSITYNEKREFECGEYCDSCSQGAGNCKTVENMIKKLATYEDLEEHGLLVRLPDDLNRILYQVNYRWTECTEYGEENNKCEIYDCECECDSRKEYYISEVDLQYIPIGNYYDRLGKFLFLTREEAEKELENGH